MRILIATGIYPPQIGGPAQYALNLKKAFQNKGYSCTAKAFGIERKLPTGLRHAWYFFRILPAMMKSDLCIALDTWSAALPAVFAAGLLHKKIIIRTGGDFLWESYVERTGDLVLFKNFYKASREKWNAKERLVFKWTKWTLDRASLLVFSTEWQRDIFCEAYGLPLAKTALVENFYGERLAGETPKEKNFIAGARPLKWKNLERLEAAFSIAQEKAPEVLLDTSRSEYGTFLEKIRHSYAVALVSIGDISPNMILDAIRCGKPFICTRETGLFEKIKDIGIFVDPENVSEIAAAIEKLAEPYQYAIYQKKIGLFNFTHSWEQIADEFLSLFRTLS